MILDEPGRYFLPTCGTINTDERYSKASDEEPTKVGTLAPVGEVLGPSLPLRVPGAPDGCAVAGDFFGNRSKFVDNKPVVTEGKRDENIEPESSS
jgi:hypothetical protein